MKKSVLWYIAICAGAIFCAAVAILAVMYSRDIFTFTSKRLAGVKSLKDKVMHPFAHKQDQIDEF